MKILTTIDLLALPSLETPPTGHVGFGAKADGLYQKIGTTETKLSVDGHTHTFASLTSKPTTLAGYGITDAALASHTHPYLPLSGGTMSNTNLVTNLNADLLDGLHIGQSGVNYIPYANSTGNVGIGITSPGAKLEVGGIIRSDIGFRSGEYVNLYLGKYSVDTNTKREYRIPYKDYISVTIRVTAVISTQSVGSRSYTSKVFYLTTYSTGSIYSQSSYVESRMDGNSIRIGNFYLDDVTNELVLDIYSTHNRDNALYMEVFGQNADHFASYTISDNIVDVVPVAEPVQTPLYTMYEVYQDLTVNRHAYIGGNVGIGTTTPSQKLHVIGNAIISGTITATTFNGSLNGNATTASSVGGVTGIGTATPLMDGTASVGTSTLAARQDHRHPTDTSRAAVGQTMYIGTTAVTINRASGTLNLTGIGSLAMAGALTGVTTLTASTSVTVPKVIFAAAGWSVEQTGTEIQFKYNGTIKQRLLSDGSIVAVGEVTAYGATS